MANEKTPAGDNSDPRTVHGYQEGAYFAPIPITPADYAALLANPDLPPQFQAAPSHEKLNPHLFPKP